MASAQVPAGGEFIANGPTTANSVYPTAAIDRDGDFVVIWRSAYDVLARLFGADGAPLGPEFTANSYSTLLAYISAASTPVAMRPNGRFVVAWTAVPNQYLNVTDVVARRFDADGLPSGPEFRVNSATTGWQRGASIAVADHGSFVVVWSSSPNLVADDVYGRVFDSGGNPIGAEFRVNSYTTGLQIWPQVGMDAAANFVVVWQGRDGHDGDGIGVFGQRFRADGAPLGAEFLVNTTTTHFQDLYGLAVAPDGRFVVTWDSWAASPPPAGPHRIFAQRYAADGTRIGGEFLVTQYTTDFRRLPFVGADRDANFVVSWTDRLSDGSGYGIQARRFRDDGSLRGSEFRVNTSTGGHQYHGRATVDTVGNFVVTWQDHAAGPYTIRAQRFGGLVPSSVAVDTAADANSDGNSVLEPGESVDLRPAWRNVNGATQTIAGGIGRVAGPGGPAIVDSAGSYGAIPTGAIRACTDCYEVSVGDPAPRPALHWDVSVVESLLPDAQGQVKRWPLHVGDSFGDVPRSSGYYRFIETLLHHGITAGCTATEYCPAASTTREQMAVFVLVAKEGAGYVPPACGTTPMFADVPASSPFCRWVEELAGRGIVAGCGGSNYCPTSPVSREQMAVFVLRTLDPTLSPPACVPPNVFLDVPETNPFCRWVEELATRGIVTGCGGGNYCPTASVTREQMGVFISATFGLSLYGP